MRVRVRVQSCAPTCTCTAAKAASGTALSTPPSLRSGSPNPSQRLKLVPTHAARHPPSANANAAAVVAHHSAAWRRTEPPACREPMGAGENGSTRLVSIVYLVLENELWPRVARLWGVLLMGECADVGVDAGCVSLCARKTVCVWG